jgi:hypothetical protein
MRQKRQGKLGKDTWIALTFVLASCLAIFGFLLFHSGSTISHRDLELKAQLNAMNMAIELFANEFDAYPSSDANDPTGRPYGGAMKLTEALMGQDLLGFHAKSIFRRDGLDAEGTLLYPADIDNLSVALRDSSLKARKGPFLPAESAHVCRLVDIYGKDNTGSFAENTFVLCDPYGRVRPSDEKTGMPILYYRANSSGTAHDVVNPDNPQNIFNYKDNQALVELGVPGKPGETHPLADPKRFYLNTQNRKTSKSMPAWGNSFILISAGQDGLYGTADDICNFEWKYRKH